MDQTAKSSDDHQLNTDGQELMLQNDLEQKPNWDGVPMCKTDGFWCPISLFNPLLSLKKNFKTNDTDIILASLPKAGTTWMKALLFSIINRNCFPIDQSPLLTTNPHQLVLSIECVYYAHDDNPNLENLPQPRFFSTHLPYTAVKSCLMDSKSKIVYVSRNPLDQFISEQYFLVKNRLQPDAGLLPIDKAFDMFCNGIHAFGPFCDHVLGYWTASLENPDKVLFVTYEDLKRDVVSNVRKIAAFMGMSFTEEEEKQGLISEISNICSFEKLKNLEINKTGVHYKFVNNSSFFRKGEVGDWTNHLTPEMAETMKKLMEEKLSGSGLMSDTYFKS